MQLLTNSYSQINRHDFHSKADLVKSGSYPGVFPSLWNFQAVQGNPSHVSGLFLRFPLKQFKYVFSVARELHRSPSVLCFGLSHSYYVSPVTLAVFGFVVSIQRRPVVVSIPSVCVSSCGGLPPRLSSLLLAQSLDRKWEIYFIWLELHCSFLTTGVTSL